MKVYILLALSCLGCVLSFKYGIEWERSRQDSLYEGCMEQLSDYTNLPADQLSNSYLPPELPKGE